MTPLARIPGHDFDDADAAARHAARSASSARKSIRASKPKPSSHACHFPPLGERSVAGPGPLQGYRATPLGEVNAQGNAATLLIPMLETPQGIANADAIAAVPGIDVLLIGSNDLCTALGIPGELKHPKIRAAYESDGAGLQGARQVLGRRRRARRRRAGGGTGQARRPLRDRRAPTCNI